jgi:hypothetical protein
MPSDQLIYNMTVMMTAWCILTRNSPAGLIGIFIDSHISHTVSRASSV